MNPVTSSIAPRGNWNVADFLLEGKDPDRVALHLVNGDRTYGELRAATAGFARYFGEIGCRKGDRVILAAENSFFWVGAYLGALHAGLVCVPLPVNIGREDLDHVLTVTEARALAAQAGFAEKHAGRLCGMHLVSERETAAPPGLLSRTDLSQLELQDAPPEQGSCQLEGDDLAALMFTSGSTGKPHGVMISHRNIIANTESILRYLNLSAADRMMTVLPFHYCFGASLLHTHLRAGASLVLDSRFLYPETILQRMLTTECTGFAGVPSHFQILLRNSSLQKKKFPHLRYVQQAGGRLAPALVHELQRALPDTQIFIMYGQTEATARLTYLPPELVEKKSGSVGREIPGVTVRVADDSGRSVKPGQAGEIVAAGENVALGYWRDPVETAKTFRNGELHTGDLATVDEEGFIYIVDRANDFLKCGGKRVSCRKVEDVVEEFECVLEAAVLPISDEVLGEAVKVFIVSRMPGCKAFGECFLAFCKEHLPAQLIPKDTVVMSSLPKNAAGKVLKEKLRSAE